MTPTQRTAALRLINTDTEWRALKWERDVIALLRELAVEPEPDPFVGTMAEQLLQVIAGIWTEHPDYSLRQTLNALNALMLPAEPVQEPQGEPVAWRTFDGEGGYDYRTFADNETYRDAYIKRNGERYASWVEPLYAAPQQRKPLTNNEISDLVLACEEERGGEACSYHDLARAVERMHGIKETP